VHRPLQDGQWAIAEAQLIQNAFAKFALISAIILGIRQRGDRVLLVGLVGLGDRALDRAVLTNILLGRVVLVLSIVGISFPLGLVVIIVPGHVTGLFCQIQFQQELFDDSILNHFSTACVDWVGNISVQPRASGAIVRDRFQFQLYAALVTVIRPEVVLTTAAMTVTRKFATGHGHKRTVVPLDNLQITNYVTIVKGNAAKAP
jgi:hypothetical protein